MFLVAMFLIGQPRGGAAQEFSADALTRPYSDGPTRVNIDIQFHVNSIDERTGTFEVDARLYAVWQDDRWAISDGNDETLSFFGDAAAELLKTRLWWPYFEITDAAAPREQMSLAVEIAPDGRIAYSERFSVLISQDFDLWDFPWDEHIIEFSVESFRLGKSEMVFVGEEPTWQFDESQEWEFAVPEIRVDEEPDAVFSRATWDVLATRKSLHYVTKIILPLVLIISIGSAVFWMNLDTMHLGDRLSVSLTSLLTVVAFDFVTSDGLPKLGYSTSLDYILILAYVFSALAILENVRASRLHSAGEVDKALGLDRVFRFAYPPLFLLAVALIWLRSVW